MLKRSVAAASVGLLLFTTALASAHPVPPPPPPVHHTPPPAHHGHGIGGLGGLAAGALIYGLVCFFPEKLSEERRKHDARWARHVDVLPCGWDTILDSPTEVTPVAVRAPAPRPKKLVCIKGGTPANGGCTRY